MADKCLFCKIIHQEEEPVYQDNLIYMFEDKFKKAEYHYLIVPKKHLRDSSHIRTIE